MRGNAKMEHRAWLLGWFGGWSCALVQFVKLMQADELERGVFESFVAQSAANHVSLCERNRVVLHPSVKVVTRAVCVKLLVRIIHTTK